MRPALAVVVAISIAALPAPSPVGAQTERRLDVSESVTFFVADASAESGAREADLTLASWALEAWARLADPPIQLVPAPEANATLRIYWVGPADGLYGETRGRVVDKRVAADVFVHPSTVSLGADIHAVATRDPLFRDTIVYLTLVHELGHAFGLRHTSAFADIMYSFQHGGDFVAYFMRFRDKLRRREDIREASPFSGGDVEAFEALYSR